MISIKLQKGLAILSVLAAMMSLSAPLISKGHAPELALLKSVEPSAELAFYTFTVFPETAHEFALRNRQNTDL